MEPSALVHQRATNRYCSVLEVHVTPLKSEELTLAQAGSQSND